jgi:hypothetical protein
MNVHTPSLGFDADVEFAPFSWNLGNVDFHSAFHRALEAVGLLPKGLIDNNVIDYEAMVSGMLNRPDADWVRFPCVTPSWDNSARRRRGAYIFHGSTPEKYEAWLKQVAASASQWYCGDERIVFINAWNKWAEGNHLEPDIRWGRGYLEATRRALQHAPEKPTTNPRETATDMETNAIRRLYWRAAAAIRRQLDLLRHSRTPR